MTKTFDSRTLSASIDGELDRSTLREVESFLEGNEEARQYVKDLRLADERLKAELNPILHDTIPPRLTAAVRDGSPGATAPIIPFWSRPLIQLAAGIALLLAGFGVGNRFAAPPSPDEVGNLIGATYDPAISLALEHTLSGQSFQWRDESGARPASIVPVRTYTNADGEFYREFRITIEDKSGPRQYRGLASRSGKDRWVVRALFLNDEVPL